MNEGAPNTVQSIGLLFRDLWRLIRGEDHRGRKVRWLLTLLRPYRLQVGLMMGALLVATGAAPGAAVLPGRGDQLDPQGGPRSPDLIVAGFVGAALLNWAAGYAQSYLVGWVGQRALQDLRLRIFRHLQGQSIGFFTRNRPGVLISRITNDVDALDQLISTGVTTLFSSLLTLIGVVVIMLLLDVGLALVVFITFPLLLIASVVFRIVAASAYRITRERIAEVTAYLQESLSGIRVVRSFGQEKRHVTRMGELNELNREANMKTVYLNASYFPAVELLSALGTAAILLFGGYQALDLAGDARDQQIGVVVAFVSYLSLFFDPIQQLSNLYTTYQQGMAALDKIFDLLDTEPDLTDRPDAIDPRPLRGDIELDDVWFSYSTDEEPDSWALRDVSIHIREGETIRWSARPEPASRRSRSSSLASTTRSAAACWSTDTTSRTCAPSACAASLESSRRRDSSSRARCATTSPSGGPRPRRRRSRRPPTRSGPASSSAAFPKASTRRSESAGSPSRRRASAHRLRPRAPRRAAHPDPRRGDLERRRPHRAGN